MHIGSSPVTCLFPSFQLDLKNEGHEKEGLLALLSLLPSSSFFFLVICVCICVTIRTLRRRYTHVLFMRAKLSTLAAVGASINQSPPFSSSSWNNLDQKASLFSLFSSLFEWGIFLLLPAVALLVQGLFQKCEHRHCRGPAEVRYRRKKSRQL